MYCVFHHISGHLPMQMWFVVCFPNALQCIGDSLLTRVTSVLTQVEPSSTICPTRTARLPCPTRDPPSTHAWATALPSWEAGQVPESLLPWKGPFWLTPKWTGGAPGGDGGPPAGGPPGGGPPGGRAHNPGNMKFYKWYRRMSESQCSWAPLHLWYKSFTPVAKILVRRTTWRPVQKANWGGGCSSWRDLPLPWKP